MYVKSVGPIIYFIYGVTLFSVIARVIVLVVELLGRLWALVLSQQPVWGVNFAGGCRFCLCAIGANFVFCASSVPLVVCMGR